MKSKAMKRVIASVMTLLMAISLLPANMLGGGVQQVKAATKTYNVTGCDANLAKPNSERTTAVYGGLASDGTMKEIAATEVGNYQFVFYSGTGKKTGYSDKSWSFGSESGGKRLETQGGIQDSGRYIATTVGAGKTATIEVIWASGGDDARFDAVKPINETSLGTALTPASRKDASGNDCSATPAKDTLYCSTYKNVPEGSYAIGMTAGGYIYSIKVDETSGVLINAPTVSEVKVLQDQTDKSKVTISGSGVAGSADSEYVIVRVNEADEATTVGTTDGAIAEFSITDTLTSSGTYKYKVYGQGTSSSDAITAAEIITYKLPLAKPSVTTAAGNAMITVSWTEVKEATSYDVVVYDLFDGTDNRTIDNIAGQYLDVNNLTNGRKYQFKVIANRGDEQSESELSEVIRPKAVDSEADFFKADDLTVQKLSENLEYTTAKNHKITILATSDKYVNIQESGPEKGDTTSSDLFDEKQTGSTKSISGETFSKVINLNGTPTSKTKPTNRAIKVELEKKGYIEVFAVSTNKTDARKLNVFLLEKDAEGNDKYTSKGQINVGGFGSGAASSTMDLEAGTYCISSESGGIAVYGIRIGEGAAPLMDWTYVDDPIITSVENNGDGTFTVNYTVDFDNGGIDTARVFAYQNGFEVSNTEITGGTSAKVAAKEDGDYTFKVVISRNGCGDKESNVYELKNYELPLESPAITWVNNLGNGSVYVDWNNIQADTFDVLYKASGASEYTTAVTGNTTGNYTVEGLTPGTEYTIKVVAHNSVKGDSSSEKKITVGDAKQQWYADVFGSATSATITVNGTEYSLKSVDASYGEGTKVEDVTNTSGTVEIAKANNGKVADSEEGIEIYYTKINPNTENFKLTATFEVIDDFYVNNQSAYGIFAMDIQGVGTKDAKYMNSVSVGQFKMFGGTYHSNGARLITGYTSYDPTSTAGTGRNLNNTNLFSVQSTDDHSSNGDKFTYTLEKTNTGFICSMDGDSTPITFNGAQNIMVQEDGSIVVGVAAARVGVRISDIKFEKTEGKVEGGAVAELVEPTFTVLSGTKTGNPDYEFIAMSNVPGTLLLWTGDRSDQVSVHIDADGAVRVPHQLRNKGGYNAFCYEFYIDPSTPNLTDYSYIKNYEYIVEWRTFGDQGENIYVSPNGGGNGGKDSPMDLQTALNYAQPGQTIVMLDGVYYPNKTLTVNRSQNGTANRPITLTAQNPGKVVVDGSKLDWDQTAALFSITGSYWNIYGIEFRNSIGTGMRVNGNYNTIEMCQFHHNGNSGLQISRGGGEPNMLELWPTGNLVKNCDSYDNCDPGRSDADGFAAKLTVGEGNKFYGCISHHNIDDGWDLYAKSTTGPIGAVTIENCVTYNNGWLSTDDPKTLTKDEFGEGNGFKLGGENMYGAHKLINSISYDNYAKGITSNSGPDCQVINCTAFNNSLSNSSYNLSLYTKTSNVKGWVVSGMLSVVDKNIPTSVGSAGYPVAELGASNGVIYSLRSSSNYLYDGSASLNTQGVKATSDWFVSTDVSIKPTRNADGSINMHGLLELKDSAPADTGARLNATASVAPVMEARAEVSDTLSEESLTEAVKKATGATTVADLIKYLQKVIVESTGAKAKLTGVNVKDTKVVDINVLISYDNGVTWIKATPDNFPKNGVDVTIPYPEGTNRYGYDFVIGHLITEDCNGLTAGTMEYFKPVKDANGLRIHIMAASPFVIGWTEADEDSGDGGASITSVATGDTTPIIPYVILMVGSLAVCVSFVFVGKKRKSAKKND
ncbi:MAG: fibronectin type III domain-containing protein [Lachnospiraceae bacterium]